MCVVVLCCGIVLKKHFANCLEEDSFCSPGHFSVFVLFEFGFHWLRLFDCEVFSARIFLRAPRLLGFQPSDQGLQDFQFRRCRLAVVFSWYFGSMFVTVVFYFFF